jgi:hypothetical protein
MQYKDLPRCPVCTDTMIMSDASPRVHPGGANDCTLRFVCEACHVETSRTVKGLATAAATHWPMGRLSDRAA